MVDQIKLTHSMESLRNLKLLQEKTPAGSFSEVGQVSSGSRHLHDVASVLIEPLIVEKELQRRVKPEIDAVEQTGST